MRKMMSYLLALLLSGAVTSCGFFADQETPEGYVRHCARILDTGLYADSPQWKAKKQEMLAAAKNFTTLDEARAAVAEAAPVAGGKHSRLVGPVRDTAAYEEIAPEVKMLEGGVAYVLLPAHSAVKVSDSLYIHTVLDFLQEHLDAAGFVIDLQKNSGGNMHPMIAAVSPLLPEGVILKFKTRRKTAPVTLQSVLRTAGVAASPDRKAPVSAPVAILTDDWTASSGEATLLCFRGLENVRVFGKPTAGYASANVPTPLADGWKLLVTIACDVARTGEVFCDDPIDPDVPTETPLEDALAWIRSRSH